jgi:hypothetical protein
MKWECVEPTRICKQKRKINGVAYCALPLSFEPPSLKPKKPNGKGWDYTRKVCTHDRTSEELNLLIYQKVETNGIK